MGFIASGARLEIKYAIRYVNVRFDNCASELAFPITGRAEQKVNNNSAPRLITPRERFVTTLGGDLRSREERRYWRRVPSIAVKSIFHAMVESSGLT